MDIYKRALNIKDEIISHRRFLHKNAEVGNSLPQTAEYICRVLKDYNIVHTSCAYGIVATVGRGDDTVLLRADMDALPMTEESGEDFASVSKNAAHTCGHDMHAAMLLGAAKLLGEARDDLKGTVKLVFQPGEEALTGCREMIDSGLLSDQSPSAAFALHVGAGKLPPGMFMYNSSGVMMLSSDFFRIEIKGLGGHSAYPHLTVDPLRIACRIYTFLESLTAKECDSSKCTVVSVGNLHGGNAGNVISDRAFIEGSIRADNNSERNLMKKRITACSKTIAEMLGGTAKITFSAEVPPLSCDKSLTEKALKYMYELSVPWREPICDVKASASDDFALIAKKIPSVYFYLSAGFDDCRGDALAHDSKVRFNEDVCPIGAAVYTQLALRYLEDACQ